MNVQSMHLIHKLKGLHTCGVSQFGPTSRIGAGKKPGTQRPFHVTQ